MEYAENGSLGDYAAKFKLSQFEKLLLLSNIANGVLHLHDRNIFHRDLKWRNILVTANGVAQVADFGTAKPLAVSANTIVGTFGHLSPEMHTNSQRDTRTDVYSFGITMFELLSEQDFAKNNEKPNLDNIYPESLRVLLEGCLKTNPKERLQMAEIVEQLQSIWNTISVFPVQPMYHYSRQCISIGFAREPSIVDSLIISNNSFVWDSSYTTLIFDILKKNKFTFREVVLAVPSLSLHDIYTLLSSNLVTNILVVFVPPGVQINLICKPKNVLCSNGFSNLLNFSHSIWCGSYCYHVHSFGDVAVYNCATELFLQYPNLFIINSLSSQNEAPYLDTIQFSVPIAVSLKEEKFLKEKLKAGTQFTNFSILNSGFDPAFLYATLKESLAANPKLQLYLAPIRRSEGVFHKLYFSTFLNWPFGMVHTGLIVGNTKLDWYDNEICIPSEIRSFKACIVVNVQCKDVVLQELVSVILKWNHYYTYNSSRISDNAGHAQTFVLDIFKALNISLQWSPHIQKYFQAVKQDAANCIPHYFNEKGKRVFFNCHAELDEYVIANKIDKDHPQYELFAGFDDAYWMNYKVDSVQHAACAKGCPFRNETITVVPSLSQPIANEPNTANDDDEFADF